MRVDKIKIINEMEGDIVVQVGATAFAEEKHVSLSKEIDLMKEIPVDLSLIHISEPTRPY